MPDACPWCRHARGWHRYRYCEFPGCGCERGGVVPDSQLLDSERAVLTILRAAASPLKTVTVRSRAGESSHGRASGRSYTRTVLERLHGKGRVRRTAHDRAWHVVEVGEPDA